MATRPGARDAKACGAAGRSRSPGRQRRAGCGTPCRQRQPQSCVRPGARDAKGVRGCGPKGRPRSVHRTPPVPESRTRGQRVRLAGWEGAYATKSGCRRPHEHTSTIGGRRKLPGRVGRRQNILTQDCHECELMNVSHVDIIWSPPSADRACWNHPRGKLGTPRARAGIRQRSRGVSPPTRELQRTSKLATCNAKVEAESKVAPKKVPRRPKGRIDLLTLITNPHPTTSHLRTTSCIINVARSLLLRSV